jgi:hypothetical protein
MDQFRTSIFLSVIHHRLTPLESKSETPERKIKPTGLLGISVGCTVRPRKIICREIGSGGPGPEEGSRANDDNTNVYLR